MLNYKQGQHIVEVLYPEHFLIEGCSGRYLVRHTCINKISLLFNVSGRTIRILNSKSSPASEEKS